MNKLSVSIKKIFLICAICLLGSRAFAADNVLQAIQVDGVKDSYNIVLRSDDVAELKKTVQAPNKMVLSLKGIRASKTINTIYNNTSSVDSVVVEPTGEDSVNILIQAANVANAGIHFDTLKTPLGVLDSSKASSKATDEIVLSGPMDSYKPVYDNNANEETSGVSTAALAQGVKKILKNEKISWMITFGFFGIFLLSGLKAIKGKDSEIKVGLTQSLKDREIAMYRGMGANMEATEASLGLNQTMPQAHQSLTGINYGLRAYQSDMKSPYVSPEIQRPRPSAAPVSQSLQHVTKTLSQKPAMQSTAITQSSQTALKTASVPVQAAKPKTTNIDSIKFLESMTKIYEKNGRSDLAQGLKANMKKAKVNLA